MENPTLTHKFTSSFGGASAIWLSQPYRWSLPHARLSYALMRAVNAPSVKLGYEAMFVGNLFKLGKNFLRRETKTLRLGRVLDCQPALNLSFLTHTSALWEFYLRDAMLLLHKQFGRFWWWRWKVQPQSHKCWSVMKCGGWDIPAICFTSI